MSRLSPEEVRREHAWQQLLRTIIRCREHPPCDALLREPLAVITDPDRWPTHFCYGTLVVSVNDWGRGLGLFTDEIPVNVGRQGVLRAAECCEEAPEWTEQELKLMPFGGEERAILIVPVPLSDVLVTLFGLAPEDSGWGGFGPCAFTVAGPRPDSRA